MTKQRAKRMKKIEAIYRMREPSPQEGRRKDASPLRHSSLELSRTGIAFIEKVRAAVEAECDAVARVSVLAVDFSRIEWSRGEWMRSLNTLVSHLAASREGAYTVELLDGPRFVIGLRSAWEGEMVAMVMGLRNALWRYSPGIGVCELIPGTSVREAVETALAGAARAATGSMAARFGAPGRPPAFTPAVA